MTIDYDRLRELANEHTPGPWEQATRGQIGNRELRAIVALVGGDESGEQIGDCNLEADRELIALAPDMARELLALRGEIERTRARITDEIERTPAELQAAKITLHTERVHMLGLCAHLLSGDYE